MISDKPRTAAPISRRRIKNHRTSSQPILKEMTVKYKFNSGDASAKNLQTMASSRQTKYDCSKLMSYASKQSDHDNHLSLLLMMNLRPKNRLKTSSTTKRKPKDDYRSIDEDMQSIEQNQPLHFKLKTRAGLDTERIVKSSISDRHSIQNLLYEKDRTIMKLRNKLVFYLILFV